MKRLVFALALVGACGGGQKKDPPSNTGGDEDADRCAVVEARARTDMQGDYPKDADADTMKMYEDMTAKVIALIGQHCRDDGWSDELLECVRTSEDTKACKSFLTAEQNQKLDDDMQKQLGARRKD
jgi:hypothetical protein